MNRRPLFMANWKMNKTMADTKEFVNAFSAYHLPESADVVICAPFTNLAILSEQKQFGIGAENIYPAEKGAFTGEISADMLKECGVKYVLVGHSERRDILGESDTFIAEKYHFCVKNGLTPVLCIGESLETREKGDAQNWCKKQLDAVFGDVESTTLPEDIIVAYEPIWAIGTGKTATTEDAQDMIGALRQYLVQLIGEERAQRARMLYGGSAKAENIGALMLCPDIDGGLVGGASLKAESFYALIKEGSAQGE